MRVLLKRFYLNGNLTIGTIRTQKSVTFAFPLKNEIQLKKTWSAAKTSFFSKVITLMTKQENSTMFYHIAIKSSMFCTDVYKTAYVKTFLFCHFLLSNRNSYLTCQKPRNQNWIFGLFWLIFQPWLVQIATRFTIVFSYYVAIYFPTEEYTRSQRWYCFSVFLTSLKQFHLIRDGEAT